MLRCFSRALGHLVSAGLIVAIAAVGAVPSLVHAAPEVSPETFSRVSSGVALIRTYGCGGKPLGQGTGFLVGTSVVMTARHVVTAACRVRVRVSGDNFVGTRVVSWYGGGASPSAADLATIKLDHATTDAFIFRVRSAPVRVGLNLGMVGYPLGNRLSLNQGRMIWRGKIDRAPLLAVRMLGAEGASGAPFIDDQGRVVGILQVGLSKAKDVLGQRTAGALMGLDLVRWWGPRARLDLCRAYPNGGIAGCPGSKPPPPPTTETVRVIAASVSATEDGPPQASFVSAPQVIMYLRVDFAAPTTMRHTGEEYASGPSGENVSGCGGDILVGWEGYTCEFVLNSPAPGSWRIVYSIDGGPERAVGFQITGYAPPPPPPPPPPPTVELVPVQNYFMSSSEACSDRVATSSVSVRRVYLCVFVGPFVQNHPARIEWVSPTGAVYPVSGTITPGYSYWYFWLEFGANPQTGIWTARFYFDNALYGQASFQRI